MRPGAANSLIFVHSALAVAAAACAFVLLRANPTSQTLIAISALGGATGSCLYPLLTPAVNPGRRVSTQDILSPLLYFAIGIVIGATSLILVLALLIGDISEHASNIVSKTGALTFGVLAGTLGTVVVRSYRRDAAAAPPIIGALSSLDNQLEKRVLGRRVVNYDGTVLAGWYPTVRTAGAEQSSNSKETNDQYLIIAKIVVALVPRKVLDKNGRPFHHYLPGPQLSDRRLRGRNTDAGDAASPRPAASTSARVTVQGGDDAGAAPFTVTMFSSDLAIVPVRAEIRAPRDAAAEPIEFTVLRTSELDAVRSAKSAPEPTRKNSALILIDLSQAGTTVQLMELDTSVSQLGRDD
ncbi:hypothetical protein [Amycolatopsis sp. NPDC004378]